jgi:hypothetical protein
MRCWNISESEQIVKLYGKAITELREGDVVQPITDLPCSPAKIKFAFFVLTKHLIDKGALSAQLAEDFVRAYAIINSRFQEQADEINREHKQIFYNSKSDIINKMKEFEEKYSLENGCQPGLASVKALLEFHNFIADCQGNYCKNGKDGDPDAMSEKGRKNN